MKDERGAEITAMDWTGARLQRIRFTGARLRTIDFSGAVLRDVDLTGAAIDTADMDGLSINGVEIAPLVEAELIRREPARALAQSSDPADLREAWAQIQAGWDRIYAEVAEQPTLAGRSVDDEWSATETLRHLVFATDVWLGQALGNDPKYHPWGLPFSGYEEYVPGGAEELGIDPSATPSYDEVLALRRERTTKVRALLVDATPKSLADEVTPPPWMAGSSVSVLRCLRVVLNEEIEHRRFVERDLQKLRDATPQ